VAWGKGKVLFLLGVEGGLEKIIDISSILAYNKNISDEMGD
jgi:hypothetical protein